jgi:hypothetical protein
MEERCQWGKSPMAEGEGMLPVGKSRRLKREKIANGKIADG